MPPSVTIVIPVYNQGQFLGEAIESALAQTYPNVEVLVVNDGSTDSSYDVALSKSEAIRVVSQKNAGLSAARNAGFKLANPMSEFILPLDADDRLDPRHLEKTLPRMSDPAVGFVSTGMQYFGSRGLYIPIENQSYESELTYNRITVCSLIRRRAFDEVGGYTNLVYGWEDWNLWLDLLGRGWKMDSVNEPLFYYRCRSDSMASRCWDHRQELYLLMRKRHPRFVGLPS